MELLTLLFGWPHELLHVLALYLVGRRPESIANTYVDIPDDLPTSQYVFVAGLPALVFWSGAILSALALFSSPDIPRLVARLALTTLFSVAAAGTIGDLYLIAARLMNERQPGGFDGE